MRMALARVSRAFQSPIVSPYIHSLPSIFPDLALPDVPYLPTYVRVAARAYRMRMHVPLGRRNACAVVEHRARQLAATGASRRGSPRSSSKAGSFRVALPASGVHVAR